MNDSYGTSKFVLVIYFQHKANSILYLRSKTLMYYQQPLHNYLTVTKEKPFQVNVYKVQKSDKEVFKKKQTWPLSDLKVVDGKAEHEVSIAKGHYVSIFTFPNFFNF